MDFIIMYFDNLLDLFIDMSFYIMLGLLVVGILHAFVNKKWITSQIGDSSFWCVVKASIIGVPLPLCSCGVVPTAIELKNSGGSNGAVVSFLTSTPQTGIDSIVATYGMLGGFMAFFRALSAFVSGIISGALVNIFMKNAQINQPTSCCCSAPSEPTSCCSTPSEPTSCCSTPSEPTSCCCSAPSEPTSCCSAPSEPTSCCSTPSEPTSCCSTPSEPTSCCSTPSEPTSCCSTPSEPTTNISSKLKSVFTYGFGSFLDEISVQFVIGLLISALISTVIPDNFFMENGFDNKFLSMILMVLIGLPMYICSTSSIPIVVSLISKGLSAGAGFVFLFTGPVTNMASLLMINKALGKKITGIYVANAIIMSILFGYLLDFIVELGYFNFAYANIGHFGHHSAGSFSSIIAIVFFALILKNFYKKYFSKAK